MSRLSRLRPVRWSSPTQGVLVVDPKELQLLPALGAFYLVLESPEHGRTSG